MNKQKTGGRQKGTPNKITAEVREFLASLVSDNADLIQQDFRNMTTEQRMNFLPKILPYIVPKVKPISDEEERKQASLDMRSIGNTAQALMLWEKQQEQEEREREKEAAEKDAEEEREREIPVTQEKEIPTAENVSPRTERKQETAQNEEQAARPARTAPVATSPSQELAEPAFPSKQNQHKPNHEKQYTVTDEELHNFMTLLCKDLEPYLQYNSLDDVDFEAIQRQKYAAVQANRSNQSHPYDPSD